MARKSHRIVPHLWFDKEAKEAASFYATVFPESKVDFTTTLEDTPGGDAELVSFEIWGQPFEAISAGPLFRPNPSISFIANFDPILFGGKDDAAKRAARKALDKAWEKLAEGGKALIPLGKYPHSEHYGWIQDRYGFSWQLLLSDPEGEPKPAIIPCFLFTGKRCGHAKAAIDFWVSVFRDSKQGTFIPYPAGQEPNPEGAAMFADFMIEKQWLSCMDSGKEQVHEFNEAVSFMIKCDDQADIDHYWDHLSADPESEQCGWLKDRFGVSWQVVPASLDDMIRSGSREQVNRVTQAFLQMKKFDLAALQLAYEGALV